MTALGSIRSGLSALVLLAGAGLATHAGELALRVEQAAAEAAARRVEPPDRFELLAPRFGGADPVEPGRLELELVEADGPNSSGVVRVQFRLRVDGVARGQARATVRGRVRGPVLVAGQTLARGVAIDPAAVELRDVDLTRHTGRPVRDVAELVGLVPVRSLGAGREITADLLRPMPVVRQGEPVELVVRRGGLLVTAIGTARRDGAPGETIPAENSASGARLLGRVLPDGSILVDRPPIPGRRR